MYIWGEDGNNSSINKRERLILILPFLTGSCENACRSRFFVDKKTIFGVDMSVVLAKKHIGRYNKYDVVFLLKED